MNKLTLEGWLGVPPNPSPPSPEWSGRRVVGSTSQPLSSFSGVEWEKGGWEYLPTPLLLLRSGVGEGWLGVPPNPSPPSPEWSGRRVVGSTSQPLSSFSGVEWEKGGWEYLPTPLLLLRSGVGEGWLGVPPNPSPPSPEWSGRRVVGSTSQPLSSFSGVEWEKGGWEYLPTPLLLLRSGVGEGWLGVPPNPSPPSPEWSGRRVVGSTSQPLSSFSGVEWEKGGWEYLPTPLLLLRSGVGEGWLGVPPNPSPPSPEWSGRRVVGSTSQPLSSFSGVEWEKGGWEYLPTPLLLLRSGVGEGWLGVPPNPSPPSPEWSGRRVVGSTSQPLSSFSGVEWEKGGWEYLPTPLLLLRSGVGEGWLGVPPNPSPPSPEWSGRRVVGSTSQPLSSFSGVEWEKGGWEYLPTPLLLLRSGVGEGWLGVPPNPSPPSPEWSGRRVVGSTSQPLSSFSGVEWEKGGWEYLPTPLLLLRSGVGEGWLGVPPNPSPPSPEWSGRRVVGSTSQPLSSFSGVEWEKGGWEYLPTPLLLLRSGVGEGWLGVPPNPSPPSPEWSGRRVVGSTSQPLSSFSGVEWEKGGWEYLPTPLLLLRSGVGEGWLGVPPNPSPPSPEWSGRRVVGSTSQPLSSFSGVEWEKGGWEYLPTPLLLLRSGVGEGWLGVPPNPSPPSPEWSGRRVVGSTSQPLSSFSGVEWEKGGWEYLPTPLLLLRSGVGEGWLGVPPNPSPPSPEWSGRRVVGSTSQPLSSFSGVEWEKGGWEYLPTPLLLLRSGVGEGWLGVPPNPSPPSPEWSGRRVVGSTSQPLSSFSGVEWEKGGWEYLPTPLLLLRSGVGEGWLGVPPNPSPPSPEWSGRRVVGSTSQPLSSFSGVEWEKGGWEYLPTPLLLLRSGILQYRKWQWHWFFRAHFWERAVTLIVLNLYLIIVIIFVEGSKESFSGRTLFCSLHLLYRFQMQSWVN